ncbi:MAG: hypothetical protein EZS28_031362, partial [Streblomastix strix]
MTAIETINEKINETFNETAQIDSLNSTQQDRPKKYTEKEQAMIAARKQHKNARI